MRRSFRVSLSIAAVGLAACSSHDTPTQPAQPVQGIKAVAGGGVADTVLSAPLQALVVEVRGSGGALAKGTTVRFSVQAPADTTRRYENTLYVCPLAAATCGPTNGYYQTQTVNVSTDTADANGRAKALVRLGTVAGPTYVIVSVPEFGMKDSVPFTVKAGAARSVVFTAHDVPLLVGGKATLKASVTDAYRNPRTDAAVVTLGTTPGVATLDAASATVTAADVGSVYAFARAGTAVDSALVRVVPPGRLLVWDAGPRAVRLVNTDGTVPRTLATSISSDFGAFPRFSPNGNVVAFHAGTDAYGGPPTRIVIVDSLGGGRRDVSAPPNVLSAAYARPLASGAVLFVGRLSSSGFVQPAPIYSVAPDNTVTTVATLPDASGVYGGIAISPDGSRVAYVAVDPNNYGRTVGLRVLTIATGQSVLVDANGTSPAWSPAGDRLAYLVNSGAYNGIDGTLAFANADGTGRTSYPAIGSFSPGLAWSPSGAYVLGRTSSSYPGGLRAVRVRDGVSVPLLLPILAQTASTGFGDYYQPDWR